jgi:predicted dinucleotide-binding enzyme
MRIAILGAGRLGKSLGTALRASGHQIVYGVREPEGSGDVLTETVGGAIAGADVVILATPWTANEAIVCEHARALAGKIVIDATNPLNTNATRLALGFDVSGVELLQSHARGATFFKAFNVAGVDAIAEPSYPQGRAAMFVAGPKSREKDIVLRLVADVGFEPVDAGDLRAARLLEPLGMLRLELEETEGRSRDFAFLLASRAKRRSQYMPSLHRRGREASESLLRMRWPGAPAATPERRKEKRTQEMPGSSFPRAMKIAP